LRTATIRGAVRNLFERTAVVFHRTHKEHWIESVATGQKNFSQKIIHGA
jgi:hypothetical protein